MRPRFVIFISIVLLAILVLILWKWKRPAMPALSTVKNVQTTNQAVSSTAQNASQTTPLANLPTSQPMVVGHKTETPEEARKEIESANVPVEFYGRFIDQDSNGLPGVDIKVVVRHWILADPVSQLAGSKDIPLEQKSDADGYFKLSSATGDAFDITSIQKDGYERESGQRGFGAIGGSFANPIIFKMWSTNIHEKLITGKYAFQIVPDGRPYFINLTDGKISESGTGDLKVWIQYTNQIKDSQLHDWSAGIDVINGGLQTTTDYAMWMAPSDGYVPSYTNAGQIKGYQTGDTQERRFYLQLKNGQEYGQMSIELIAPYNNGIPSMVRLSYAINPSGSRVLK